MSTRRQRLLERLGQELVGARGLGDAGRMVVREDHRRGVVGERRLEHLARVDAGLRQRAAEQLLGGEQAVLAVEEQRHEGLVRQRGERQAQVVAHGLGRGERVALREARRARAGARARPRPSASRRAPRRSRAAPARRADRRAEQARRRRRSAAAHRARGRRPTRPRRRCAARRRAARRRTAPRRPCASSRSRGRSCGDRGDSVRPGRPTRGPMCGGRGDAVRASTRRRWATLNCAHLACGSTAWMTATDSRRRAADAHRAGRHRRHRRVQVGRARAPARQGRRRGRRRDDRGRRALRHRDDLPGAVAAARSRDDLWHSGADNAMGHIGLSRGADPILVAPATADFLAKLAHGRADDLLSTLCLARECPLLVAPAMNVQMWAQRRHAAQRRAAAQPTA